MLFDVLVFGVDIATVYFVFSSLMWNLTPLRLFDLDAGSFYISGSSLNVDIGQHFRGLEDVSHIYINITDRCFQGQVKKHGEQPTPVS